MCATAVPPHLAQKCYRLVQVGVPPLRKKRQGLVLADMMLGSKNTFSDWVDMYEHKLKMTGHLLREAQTIGRALDLDVHQLGPGYLGTDGAEILLRRLLCLVTAAKHGGSFKIASKFEELPADDAISEIPEEMFDGSIHAGQVGGEAGELPEQVAPPRDSYIMGDRARDIYPLPLLPTPPSKYKSPRARARACRRRRIVERTNAAIAALNSLYGATCTDGRKSEKAPGYISAPQQEVMEYIQSCMHAYIESEGPPGNGTDTTQDMNESGYEEGRGVGTGSPAPLKSELISFEIAKPLSVSKSKIATFAPIDDSMRDVASPNPEAPPVTTADTLPFISIDHLTIYFLLTMQITLLI